MERKFKSIRLTKNDNLEISYTTKDEKGNNVRIDEKHPAEVHDDFKNQMNKLRVHLGIMTGYIDKKNVKKPQDYGKLVDSFHVRKYSIGGGEDAEGIVISGHRILPDSGKAVILNTPFERFDVDEEKLYKFIDDLSEVITGIEYETNAYLAGKIKEKEEDKSQLKMSFDQQGAAPDPDETTR